MEKLQYELDVFQGPLDLLLALIAKNKIEITDIPIAQLLEQYMEQIRQMQEADIDVASEFLEMAARLVQIKAAFLLPRREEEEDPRLELAGQLLEYQSCKAAAALLEARGEGFEAFVRPQADIPLEKTYTLRHPAALLAGSFRAAMGRGRRRLPPEPKVFSPLVAAPVVSVSSRILFILRRLYKKTTMSLSGLFLQSRSRSEAVATFMALLELMRAGRVRLTQGDSTILFLGREAGKQKGGGSRAAERDPE